MNLGNLYEDEATPIAAVNDNSRCYLCQMDHQQPMIRLLDNIEFRLCGKIKDVELWKTMAEAYQEQMKVVAQQGLSCVASLSEDVFEHHYTKHHVCPKRQIYSDLEAVNTVLDQLKRAELLSQTESGVVVNTGSVKVFKQLSQHKLELLKALKAYEPDEDDIPVVKINAPYSFS